MNKTVNINIGGLYFHIDEDAYQKLSHYFEAIKKYLSNSSGKDEIMKDIEMRVAELLIEKQKSEKHVINSLEIDSVIEIMGQPEDYKMDEDSFDTPTQNNTIPRRKRLYRDIDHAAIGGVATGLGHYLGIDAVIIKVAFIFFTIVGGFGIITYLIFWIATPAAVTTSEKLEMTGEPVNISNIEKKIREKFEKVTDKINNADYNEIGSKAGNGLEKIIVAFFQLFVKILGAFVILTSSIILTTIFIISILILLSSSLNNNFLSSYLTSSILFTTPLWIQGLLFLFLFGIPTFLLLFLGIKIISSNSKTLGNTTKYSLFTLWILSLFLAIWLGINEAKQISYNTKEIQREPINALPSDTLVINFKKNDYYTNELGDYIKFELMQNEKNEEVIYSNNVSLEINRTDETTPYIVIEKKAFGKSLSDARNRAKKIDYKYSLIGKTIILDNYWTTNPSHKYRKQYISIFVYLPKGTIVKSDFNFQEYIKIGNNFIYPKNDIDNYLFKMDNSQLSCLNCPKIDTTDTEHESVSIKIGGKEIIKTETIKR